MTRPETLKAEGREIDEAGIEKRGRMSWGETGEKGERRRQA